MSVALALSGMVTKWIVGAWLKDTPFATPADDLISFVRENIADARSGRKASRQFEELAELIEEKLEPFIESEFGNTDSGEREAAATAVVTTLEVGFESRASIVAVDLDATALESELRRITPRASEQERLSSDGKALYDLLLTECCNYIAATASSMPEFGSQAAEELLQRTSRILEIGGEILNRLPTTMPETWGHGSESEIFTSKYQKAVVQKHDRLQLYGVRDSSYTTAYSLSVAYIGLTATIPVVDPVNRTTAGSKSELGRAEVRRNSEGGETKRPELDDEALRVEAALSGHPKIVLGGNAGSGKTTLLQWIAVTASQGRFSGELSDWNGCVPFMIPLRRFANSQLPSPEEWVRVNHQALAGLMPGGWVHRVLAEGAGLVLIDGLDELPEEQRSAASDWLLDLLQTFPSSRFIVTARPLAISGDWARMPGFKYAELLPMQRADIRAFVSHWHAAAAHEAKDADARDAVERAERHMIDAVNEMPAIRMLCTSPLLCALICAMHRQNVNKLPDNRMELYETALQMLVASRDEQRQIDVPEQYRLSYPERRALLADFALWLHENGASDAANETYEARIAKKLQALPRSQDRDATVVSQQLLLRSGVLRQPVEGRVDFVHRTFLEYLAASELVEDRAFSKIVDHAHLDQWREVVIMAAGHSGSADRRDLLEGLVRRGEEDLGLRHRMYLLAVGCLETSPVLDPAMQDLLSDCLDEVMPPTNMTEASAVASAGALAVPRLGNPNVGVRTAAACIRALSIIGTDEALDELKKFAPDTRVTVNRQLIKAWGQFDAEKYAREVLADNILDEGHILVNSVEFLPHLPLLKHAQSVFLDLPGKVDSFRALPRSESVFGFDLSRSRGVLTLQGIERFPNLISCWIEDSDLESLSGIEDCPNIRSLFLDRNLRLANVEPVRSLPALQTVHLVDTAVSDLSAFDGVGLEVLRVGGLHLRSIPDGLAVKKLSITRALHLDSLDPLESAVETEDLQLFLYPQDKALRLTIPYKVKSLTLRSGGMGLSVIEGGGSVETADVGRNEFHQLPHMPNLANLTINHSNPRVERELDVSRFPELQRLTVYGHQVDLMRINGMTRETLAGRPPFRATFRRS